MGSVVSIPIIIFLGILFLAGIGYSMWRFSQEHPHIEKKSKKR